MVALVVALMMVFMVALVVARAPEEVKFRPNNSALLKYI